MSSEEKQHAKETAKEIFKEDRSRIIREAVEDAADYTAVMATEELIAAQREQMIEAGVFDEYTKASNVIDLIAESGGFFKKVFKRKK